MKNISTLFCFLLIISFAAHGQVIITIAGNSYGGYNGDNIPATDATFTGPEGIACDMAGNLLIADRGNKRIRKISPSGIITTIAGNGSGIYSGDNGPATNAGIQAHCIAIDNSGNIYISEEVNCRIRKINFDGIITTIAGTGAISYSGDGGPATAALINSPGDITVDNNGNIYFADLGNHRVRKINPLGIISTIAGTGTSGFSGDNGPATAANIAVPGGIKMDALGNLYISDYVNRRIRRVNPDGIINTIAGTGIMGSTGDAGPATAAAILGPGFITLDKYYNIYISEQAGNRIRKINTSGIITTITGNGTPNFSGDNGPATLARIHTPLGLVIDNFNNLVFSDFANNRIRSISNIGLNVSVVANTEISLSVYPNPSSGTFYIDCNSGFLYLPGTLIVTDLSGKIVKNIDLDGSHPPQIPIHLPVGEYVCTLNANGKVASQKIVIR